MGIRFTYSDEKTALSVVDAYMQVAYVESSATVAAGPEIVRRDVTAIRVDIYASQDARKNNATPIGHRQFDIADKFPEVSAAKDADALKAWAYETIANSVGGTKA